eukprot:3603552-Ditylum_brightwellii.AAC.1
MTNGNIEQLMLSIAQIGKRCEESATMNQLTSLMATQNMLNADMVQLHTRVEQIERAGGNPGPTVTPDRSKGVD